MARYRFTHFHFLVMIKSRVYVGDLHIRKRNDAWNTFGEVFTVTRESRTVLNLSKNNLTFQRRMKNASLIIQKSHP